MVFFTCDACGESLKKAQVDKHVSICRNCQCLSCIDCGKDFWGDDYKTHLKCISEDQKYGGKAFEAKANKGDVKQQLWIQRIHEVMKKPNITPKLKDILSQISTYDNIPRKKAKFQNWMKNSLKIFNQALQDQVWEIFSEATSTPKEDSNKNGAMQPDSSVPEKTSEPSAPAEETEKKKSKRERKEERQKKNKKEKKHLNSEENSEKGAKKKGKKHKDNEDKEEEEGGEERPEKKKKRKHQDEEEQEENGEVEEDEEPTSRKRRKHEESDEPEEENCVEENGDENSHKGKFNWKGTIKALLRQADDHELPIKKLRKKVLAQYYAVSSTQHKSEEELLALFNKKIQNNPKFRVLKERVKLIK